MRLDIAQALAGNTHAVLASDIARVFVARDILHYDSLVSKEIVEPATKTNDA